MAAWQEFSRDCPGTGQLAGIARFDPGTGLFVAWDGKVIQGAAGLAPWLTVITNTPLPCLDTGTGKTLKSKAFTVAVSGVVVPAVPGKRIKVYAVKLFTTNAISVNWRDDGATLLEGAQPLLKNGGYTEAVTPPAFLFATSVGSSLDLVVTGAAAAGRVSYWDDDAT